MMSQDTLILVAVLLSAAFIPSLVYMVWIRNTERFGRVSWVNMFKMFTWGAVIAVIMALLLSWIFIYVLQTDALQREYEALQDRTVMTLVIVCVVAPLVEEFTKMVGLYKIKDSIIELEDGLILGAGSGLGFAATENLLYESNALFTHGVQVFIMVVILRSVASTLLHGSASAVAGYGVSKSLLNGGFAVVPYYFVAVIMHGAFNYLASVGLLYDGNIPLFALIAALVFSVTAFKLIRQKITELDDDSAYFRRKIG